MDAIFASSFQPMVGHLLHLSGPIRSVHTHLTTLYHFRATRINYWLAGGQHILRHCDERITTSYSLPVMHCSGQYFTKYPSVHSNAARRDGFTGQIRYHHHACGSQHWLYCAQASRAIERYGPYISVSLYPNLLICGSRLLYWPHYFEVVASA